MKFMKSLISLGLHKTPEVYLTGDFMKFMIFLKKKQKGTLHEIHEVFGEFIPQND